MAVPSLAPAPPPSAPARGGQIPWRAVLVFAASLAILQYHHGWYGASLTLALAALAWLICALLTRWHMHGWRKLFGYALFFLTPLLTWNGQISVLTGFGGSSVSLPWLGIAFVSASLALHVTHGALNWRNMLYALQPLRFNSGPCALPPARPHRRARLSLRRARVALGWLVAGAFFYSVLAAGIAPLLMLKPSTDALDILAFAILFEAYVYFNFSGVSFMVLGLLQLAGVPVLRNFNLPFAARDVIGYWQRWHLSLSAILKALFFQPLKSRLGLAPAVLTVFLCSALWHGVSLNFVLWGAFHAGGWLLAHALGRHLPGTAARVLNAALLPLIIVPGRLIFSEADSAQLLFKLQQLCLWHSNGDAWLYHLALDGKTVLILLASLIWLLAEVLWSRPLRNYRLLRGPWMTLLLASVCLAFGNSGLGSVYGAR